ncbi:uncharacterized protein LOC141638931 [Silene latifolia]|uniref:uncharacterized protein LOC141638931 n=1 Tax=Silene latifolia TaxID=37657 RepID=UPI003D781E80
MPPSLTSCLSSSPSLLLSFNAPIMAATAPKHTAGCTSLHQNPLQVLDHFLRSMKPKLASLMSLLLQKDHSKLLCYSKKTLLLRFFRMAFSVSLTSANPLFLMLLSSFCVVAWKPGML